MREHTGEDHRLNSLALGPFSLSSVNFRRGSSHSPAQNAQRNDLGYCCCHQASDAALLETNCNTDPGSLGASDSLGSFNF